MFTTGETVGLAEWIISCDYTPNTETKDLIEGH